MPDGSFFDTTWLTFMRRMAHFLRHVAHWRDNFFMILSTTCFQVFPHRQYPCFDRLPFFLMKNPSASPKLDPQIYKNPAKGGQRYGKKAGYRTEGRNLSQTFGLTQPRPAFFSATGRFLIS
jgi:hypothetical protein